MNIYDYLKRDHQKIRALLLELNHANDENKPEARQQLINQLTELMAKHSQLEIETIYNVLHENQEFNEETQALKEHDEVTQLLKEFTTISSATEKWNKYINVLQDKIIKHINHEEESLFPEVRKLATPHLDRELSKQIELVDKDISL